VESLTPAVTKPKGFAPDHSGMNAIETAREARSQNLARLRKLTIGTAALSVAATSGFGWLAAMSTAAASSATTAYTTTTTTSASTATSGTSSTSTTTAPTVGSVFGQAHVTSGGS
jgi:ATP phosphoribosyltransferase